MRSYEQGPLFFITTCGAKCSLKYNLTHEENHPKILLTSLSTNTGVCNLRKKTIIWR